jgi:hypothetical protein
MLVNSCSLCGLCECFCAEDFAHVFFLDCQLCASTPSQVRRVYAHRGGLVRGCGLDAWLLRCDGLLDRLRRRDRIQVVEAARS